MFVVSTFVINLRKNKAKCDYNWTVVMINKNGSNFTLMLLSMENKLR